MIIWLKKIREELNLTQEQVAVRAHISQQYYGHIESGIRGQKLPVPTAKAIATVLHFNWRRFYDDSDIT